ncbi:Achilles [Carabus blaptoides fortunei]
MPEPQIMTPIPQEEQDEVGCLSFSPPPMKHSETRDSISSIDSDVSLSFDNDKTLIEHPAEDEGAHMADLSDSASDTGSAGGKDSGCEVTPEVKEPPFTPPSDELADKIVAQVEFYFSDVNITKDAFLLKHVKRNKEGYVSLKLISSFKRVKHLTKDWRVVAHALIRSKKLEINEAGTKLRRIDPLPQYDQTAPSRTIVAVHMPIDKPTIENVAELFSSCGEIALIRVLRPGNPIPADVRQFINKNPSLSGMVCALVEFVDSESARNAIQMQNTFGEPLKVYELNGIPNPEPEDYRVKMDPKGRLRRGSSAHFPPRCTEPIAWLQRRLSATSTEAGFLLMPRRLSASSRDSSESSLHLSRRISNCSLTGSESGSGYATRRMSSSSITSDSSGPRSRSNSSAFHLPENVLRMPQGPDGSRGFRQRFIQPAAN